MRLACCSHSERFTRVTKQSIDNSAAHRGSAAKTRPAASHCAVDRLTCSRLSAAAWQPLVIVPTSTEGVQRDLRYSALCCACAVVTSIGSCCPAAHAVASPVGRFARMCLEGSHKSDSGLGRMCMRASRRSAPFQCLALCSTAWHACSAAVHLSAHSVP